MNKRTLFGLTLIALSCLIGAPDAQAQSCSSDGLCLLNNCHWYNHIADSTFSNGCTNWEYQGTAGVTTSNMCGWASNPVGYLSRNAYASGGVIRQPFTTSTSYLDVYSFEYFIETTNMQPGDTVKVYVVDASTYPAQWYLVDTITTNVSCSKRTHSFTNPGWKGHFLHVRFDGNFASTSTKAHIDYVSFWQKTQ